MAGGHTSADLAGSACRQVMEETGYLPAQIAMLLLCPPRSPDYLLASEATHVQSIARLDHSIALGASDLGCVSVSAAIMLAESLLATHADWDAILVAHGSRPTGTRRFRAPVTINGDGGVAMVLSRTGPLRILDSALETSGGYWDLFRVAYREQPVTEWTESCRDPKDYSFKLAVESRNRFAKMVKSLLARNRLALDDVEHLIMQNISAGSFAFYEQCLNMPVAAACRDNLYAHGHLGAMDIPLNLKVALSSGELQPGDRVLIINNAPVAAWSVMLAEVVGA